MVDYSQVPSVGVKILKSLPYTIDEMREISLLSLDNTGNRIKFGNFVEQTVVAIFRDGGVFSEGTGRHKRILNVEVEHLPCEFSTGMTREERSEVIRQNAVNGDVRIRFDGGDWIYIDVKGGSRVAVDSLDRLRPDAFYMFNAMAHSKGKFYFMVRNNSSFQSAIREMGILENNLYDVHYDRHLRLDKYPGLEFEQRFDPDDFSKALHAFQHALTANGIRNILSHGVC